MGLVSFAREHNLPTTPDGRLVPGMFMPDFATWCFNESTAYDYHTCMEFIANFRFDDMGQLANTRFQVQPLCVCVCVRERERVGKGNRVRESE